MIAVTIQTKIHFIVPKERVHRIASDVQTTDVFRLHGIVMEMMVSILKRKKRRDFANN